MSFFTISSVQTKYYLVSDGQERPGEKVKTISEHSRETVSPFTIALYHY